MRNSTRCTRTTAFSYFQARVRSILFLKYGFFLTQPGEILPPRSDRILKINNARSFSIPKLPLPENIVYPKPDAPIFKENLELLNWYDPELTSAEVVSKRFCL